MQFSHNFLSRKTLILGGKCGVLGITPGHAGTACPVITWKVIVEGKLMAITTACR